MEAYTVTWAYRDGNESSKGFDTFAEALEFYRRQGSRDCAVRMSADGCEHDGERWLDGLSDEEREQL